MITFIHDFVERFEGPHPGYALLSGRPQSGILHAIKLIALFLKFFLQHNYTVRGTF